MFRSIARSELPDAALLQQYAGQGEYTDCFATGVVFEPSLPAFVEAFYTTWLFKAERLVLKWLLKRPSTDEEARQVALGQRDAFAAWTVEERRDDQLLLIDVRRQTGSWFMVASAGRGGKLMFGSVVFKAEAASGRRRLRWSYRLLMGVHRLYSRALLSAARARLVRLRRAGS